MRNSLLAVLCAGWFGCTSPMTPHAFKNFVENDENGFTNFTETPVYRFRLLYTPPEYLAVNYFRSDDIKADDFRRMTDDYAHFDSYRLEITSGEAKAFEGLTFYFAFRMQAQLKKVCGTDTLSCIQYHAEPYNTMEGKQKIEFGFAKTGCSRPAIILLAGSPLAPSDLSLPVPSPQNNIPKIELH